MASAEYILKELLMGVNKGSKGHFVKNNFLLTEDIFPLQIINNLNQIMNKNICDGVLLI